MSRRLMWAGVLIVAFLSVLLGWRREPKYEGRPLRTWLVDSSSPDEETRALAREILQHVGPEAVPVLLREVGWVDPWKIKVMDWLARHTPLKLNLQQRGSRLEGALLALSALGTNSAPAVPMFVRWLGKDPFTGAYCLNVVGAALRDHPLAERAVPMLVQHLGDDPDTRDAVQGALRGFGACAASALVLALTNKSPILRERAASMLAEVGGPGTVVPKLAVLLHDAQPGVRGAAAKGLGGVGRKATVAGLELFGLLNDADSSVRLHAASALARLGIDEDQALATVLATLNSTNIDLRVESATELRRFGRQTARVIPLLVRELTNSYARVEVAVAAAAEASAQTSGAATSLEGLRWREGYFRVNAVRSLEALLADAPQLAPAAIPFLIRAIDDDQDWVRAPAAETLARIGSAASSAVPELLRALKAVDRDVSRAAVRALAQIAPDDPRVPAALLAAMDESPPDLRAASVESLGFCNTTEAIVVRLSQALTDPHHRVRLAAAQAMERFGAGATPAKAALQRASHDPFPSIRTAAGKALAACSQQPASTTEGPGASLSRPR